MYTKYVQPLLSVCIYSKNVLDCKTFIGTIAWFSFDQILTFPQI